MPPVYPLPAAALETYPESRRLRSHPGCQRHRPDRVSDIASCKIPFYLQNLSCMKDTAIEKALTYIEPGPVVLVSTFDGKKNNVMTISWTMPIDFSQHIVLTTGPWNHSFGTILQTKECVIGIPPADMIETVVKIGTVSGAGHDKFEMFGLRPLRAKKVKAPLIDGCIACLECRLVDHIEKYGFLILEVVRVAENPRCRDRRILHARGDGVFFADGQEFNCRELMSEKLPPGL